MADPVCDIKYNHSRVRTTDYISAIGDNVILLITEGQTYNDGKILEYNTQTNQVMERDRYMSPTKVCVVQAGHHTKYIVKCLIRTTVNWAKTTKWVVKIYNRAWNRSSTIDKNAEALTVTPDGKLLIVNDSRILEYSQDGTLIRELLDKYKFNKIQDITWSGGCLWVQEVNPCCIKIFATN